MSLCLNCRNKADPTQKTSWWPFGEKKKRTINALTRGAACSRCGWKEELSNTIKVHAVCGKRYVKVLSKDKRKVTCKQCKDFVNKLEEEE